MGKCLSDTPAEITNSYATQLNPNTERKVEPLHLMVVFIDRTQTAQEITISRTATVADLKQLISKETGIHLQGIKLSIQSPKKPLLKEQLCLIDYGIMNDTYILVQRSNLGFSLKIKCKPDNKSVTLVHIANVFSGDKIKTILPQIYNRISTLPTQCKSTYFPVREMKLLYINQNKESIALDVNKTFSDYKINHHCIIFVDYPKMKHFNQIPFKYLSTIHCGDTQSVKIRKHFEENMKIYNAKIVTMLQVEKNREINKSVFENILSSKTNRKTNCLYHGTGFNHLKTILEKGFDRDYNQRSMYGKGTYLAANPATSSQYCKRYNGESAVYCMLVCNTIIGESARGCQGKSWTKSDGTEYDSLVDDLQNPNIYVIKKDYHSYPEYVIIFQYLSDNRR